jgi:hypothetical protein
MDFLTMVLSFLGAKLHSLSMSRTLAASSRVENGLVT